MTRFLVALLAILAAPTTAPAEEPTPEQRATTVRGKLGQPNPIDAVSFEGDLTIGSLWAGTASLEARPHKFARQAVWSVVEKYFLDYQGIEKHVTLRYMLAADLALRSGSAEVNIEGTKITTAFGRAEKGFQLLRTTKKPDGKPKSENLVLRASSKATTGLPALMLFARALDPRFTKAHVLPWFPLTELAMGSTPGATRLQVLTVSPMPKKQQLDVGWGMLTVDGNKTSAVHTSSDRRRLVRFEGADFKIVPKGQGGKRVELSEEKPAKTWEQAFLKFGYGYHMAKRKLLDEAFHWASMYEHETKVTKSWKGTDDLDAFREAWLSEFLRQSLHRTRAATRKLLNMTLASGRVTKKSDDEVVFAAHKNFGGGTQRTYALKRVEGIWYIAWVVF